MSKECNICGKKVVHDERKWAICLDCVVDLMLDHSHSTYNGAVLSSATENPRGMDLRNALTVQRDALDETKEEET